MTYAYHDRSSWGSSSEGSARTPAANTFPQYDLGYVKTKELTDRWSVDRSSVAVILSAHNVGRSSFHQSPRYLWRQVLTRVEGISPDLLSDMKTARAIIATCLWTTAQMADALCVTPQTIRNYVKAGRLNPILLTERTPRFFPFGLCENADEVKGARYSKK